MSKISDLEKITGNITRSEDLFVTVNLAQGDDGTKAITRAELVNSLEREIFNEIKIDGGEYIKNIDITDQNIFQTESYSREDVAPSDYVLLKDVSLNTTVALPISEILDYVSGDIDLKKPNKVYVSVYGNDENAGGYNNPVATLEKAIELANVAANNSIATAISVLPGDHYTEGNLALPDLCSIVSTNGQYSTKIIMKNGFEKENCILLGSGCYVQGFSFFNLQVDNFDYPSKGFAFAFRPGVRIIRSPYIRDSSQISNYFSREIAPPLNPLNSKGGSEDLGYEVNLTSISGVFEVNDTVVVENTSANTTVTGAISRVDEIGSGTIYIRNNSGDLTANSTVTSSSGGTATIDTVGEEDFPNKEVGRGGGMILADRAVVDQDSIFPYILAFGATPRTQNGIGYVAKNGAGINGISSLSIFARCSFYALDGGQITLNNSGTQFGDISMRAKGSTEVFNPYETNATLVANTEFAQSILDNANTIIDDMWNYLTINQGYSTELVDEELTRRDANNFLISIANDFKVGKQVATRIFAAGLFDYDGNHVFPVFNANTSGLNYIDSVATVGDLPDANTVNIDDSYIVYSSSSNLYDGTVYYSNGSTWENDGANDITLLTAFTDSWDRMRDYITAFLSDGVNTTDELIMLDGLVDDALIASVRAPRKISFGSLVESLSHQFNLASAGVNVNALPLNFRRLGQPISAVASVSQEDGGRVRWSGADELNNQYFAKGLRINGRTGKLEGRPFTSSVRKLARRASNSRATI